jgi:hypothetical protein
VISGPFFEFGMKSSDLITHFAGQVVLPIDVNAVLSCIKDNGVERDVEFIGVDYNTDILRGQIRIFYNHPAPYADPVVCANIYYDRSMPSEWQRFVCCKELFHLLDPFSATTTGEEIQALAESIGLMPEMQVDALDANIDRLAEFRALAVMFPFAARNLLLPKLNDESISIDDIARLADIPRRYAAFAMNERWGQVHELLLRIDM